MTRRAAFSLFIAVALPLLATAQVRLLPDEVERVDVVAIERDGRDFYAFDSLSGGRSAVRLELGEEVRFQRSQGRIGLVLTDRRALGIAAGGGWQEFRYRLNESLPETGLIGDRTALVVTGRRALGFGSLGVWVDEGFSPQESARVFRVGAAVGVVATNRRLLGLAAHRSRFVSIDLQVNETIESVSTQDTIVSLRTNRRILVFSGPRGSWSEQDRKIN